MTFGQAYDDHKWDDTRLRSQDSRSLWDVKCVCCGKLLVDLKASGNLGCGEDVALEVMDA